MVMNERLLTTTEAAQFLGVSKAFLERDRWAGARIPFVRVGDRAVRYQLSELEVSIPFSNILKSNMYRRAWTNHVGQL
jgi:excisionase family DNA binding protein